MSVKIKQAASWVKLGRGEDSALCLRDCNMKLSVWKREKGNAELVSSCFLSNE